MISTQSENGFHSTLGNTIVRRVVCGEIHCRWTISPKHKHTNTNTNHNKHLEMQHSAKSDKRIKEYALRRSQFMFYLTLMLPFMNWPQQGSFAMNVSVIQFSFSCRCQAQVWSWGWETSTGNIFQPIIHRFVLQRYYFTPLNNEIEHKCCCRFTSNRLY